jgi:hypothetical protein
VRLYRTGLWSTDDQNLTKSCSGRGWRISYRENQFTGTDEDFYRFLADRRERFGYSPAALDPPLGQGVKTFRFASEVLIAAESRLAAQRALSLIGASLSVLDGVAFLEPNQLLALLEAGEDFEDLRLFGGEVPQGAGAQRDGIAQACAMACRASRNRHVQYALFKLQQSYRTMSVDLIEYHPAYQPRQFGVEKDPLHHVQFASAITMAYSAIEELQLELRASAKKPTLLPGGTFNPAVQEDVKGRLASAGIAIAQLQIWNLRGPVTRIEKARPLPKDFKASWSGRSVRDREIPLAEALRLASWLRSKVTTHRFNKNSQSLTMYDVINVQQLARRLLLEHLRAWPKQ